MKFSRVSVVSFLALGVMASGSIGCAYPEELNFGVVAMCADVKDGGNPLSGPASIHATVLRRGTAYVWEYSGEGVLDSQGRVCLNLNNATKTGYLQVDSLLGKLDVETLTVTAGGRTVSGVLTLVDIDTVTTYPYAEAEFDFANTTPGEPGALAVLDLIQRSGNELDRSRRENEALAVGPERDERFRSDERRAESTEAAI